MKTIIFGNRELAELAHYYLTNDTDQNVVGFCVDGAYLKENEFCGLPVVPFEEVKSIWPTEEHMFLAPVYANNMNVLRSQVAERIEQIGYTLTSYISSKAYTWNATIGKNAFILEGCNIQPFVKIGKNVMMWSFTHIGHHSIVDDDNFLSGNVVVAGKCHIKSFCFLGTNCSTRDGLTIEVGTFVGMDASLLNDTDPWSVYVGVPAKKIEGKSSRSVKL